MRVVAHAVCEHRAMYDKGETYSVEGDNAGLRHYMARLTRRSRCFSKCIGTQSVSTGAGRSITARNDLLIHRHVGRHLAAKVSLEVSANENGHSFEQP